MRLFIAVKVPEEILNNISKTQLEFKALNTGKIKWVKPSAMHITLKFLGEVEEDKLERVINALESVEFNSAKIVINKLGVFPKINRARVLWAGVSGERTKNGSLEILADKVNTVLESLGFEKDKRRFKAHLTLARFKNKPDKKFTNLFFDKKDDVFFGGFVYDSIILYQSILKPEGAEYKVIRKFKAKKINGFNK